MSRRARLARFQKESKDVNEIRKTLNQSLGFDKRSRNLDDLTYNHWALVGRLLEPGQESLGTLRILQSTRHQSTKQLLGPDLLVEDPVWPCLSVQRLTPQERRDILLGVACYDSFPRDDSASVDPRLVLSALACQWLKSIGNLMSFQSASRDTELKRGLGNALTKSWLRTLDSEMIAKVVSNHDKHASRLSAKQKRAFESWFDLELFKARTAASTICLPGQLPAVMEWVMNAPDTELSFEEAARTYFESHSERDTTTRMGTWLSVLSPSWYRRQIEEFPEALALSAAIHLESTQDSTRKTRFEEIMFLAHELYEKRVEREKRWTWVQNVTPWITHQVQSILRRSWDRLIASTNTVPPLFERQRAIVIEDMSEETTPLFERQRAVVIEDMSEEPTPSTSTQSPDASLLQPIREPSTPSRHQKGRRKGGGPRGRRGGGSSTAGSATPTGSTSSYSPTASVVMGHEEEKLHSNTTTQPAPMEVSTAVTTGATTSRQGRNVASSRITARAKPPGRSNRGKALEGNNEKVASTSTTEQIALRSLVAAADGDSRIDNRQGSHPSHFILQEGIREAPTETTSSFMATRSSGDPTDETETSEWVPITATHDTNQGLPPEMKSTLDDRTSMVLSAGHEESTSQQLSRQGQQGRSSPQFGSSSPPLELDRSELGSETSVAHGTEQEQESADETEFGTPESVSMDIQEDHETSPRGSPSYLSDVTRLVERSEGTRRSRDVLESLRDRIRRGSNRPWTVVDEMLLYSGYHPGYLSSKDAHAYLPPVVSGLRQGDAYNYRTPLTADNNRELRGLVDHISVDPAYRSTIEQRRALEYNHTTDRDLLLSPY